MYMPFGTVTADDIIEVLQTTTCVGKIKEFDKGRGRELKIWGPPWMLSLAYAKMFEKVRENGAKGGRKSKEEQKEVNKEFVRAYPRGDHRRKSITTATPDDEPTPPQEAPMAAKTKMPNGVKTKQSKNEEGAPRRNNQTTTPMVLELFNEITTMTPWHTWTEDHHHGTMAQHMFWSAHGPLPPWHEESPSSSTWCSSSLRLEMGSCPPHAEFIPGLGAVPLFEQIPASEEPPLPLQPPPGCPEKPPLGTGYVCYEYVSWGIHPGW